MVTGSASLGSNAARSPPVSEGQQRRWRSVARGGLRRRRPYIRKPASTERFPCCSDSEWSVQTTTSTVARQASAIIVRNERPVAGRRCLPGEKRGWAPRSSTRLSRRRISVFPRRLSPPPRRMCPTSPALGGSPRRQLTHAWDECLRLFSALVASTAGRDLGNRSTRVWSRARSSLQKDSCPNARESCHIASGASGELG